MIYLDYNATTPLDPRVLEAMMPFFRGEFGNAASRHHALGARASEAIEKARAQVASVIGADPREIYWTSGATESDNLAIKGVAMSPAYRSKGNHIVTVATEHRAVLDTCEFLESQGFKVTYLPVDRDGDVDLPRLSKAISEKTILVSVMSANNETGVLHPIATIGLLCKERGILFHTDATQSFGKVPIDVEAEGIDLLSLSAHKICGPKGVGALYVRRRNPHVRCEPLIHGGGHEKGLRSGTLNVPAIVGIGAAAAICREEMPAERERVGKLRDLLEWELRPAGAQVNGAFTRLPNTTNLSFPGVDAEKLIKQMPEIAVSTSSACTSAMMQPSYVLGAMGASEDQIRGSVRFSLGRFTTEEEIRSAARQIAEAVRSLRERSAR
jgi:cysteine desulfurase